MGAAILARAGGVVCVRALAATALCKKIALKFGIVDKPDNLVKTHKKPVAYLGGVGMLVGFAVGVLTGLYLTRDMELAVAAKWLLGTLGGAVIACSVGVIDDLFDISPGRKMLGQVVAAAVLVGPPAFVRRCTMPQAYSAWRCLRAWRCGWACRW